MSLPGVEIETVLGMYLGGTVGKGLYPAYIAMNGNVVVVYSLILEELGDGTEAITLRIKLRQSDL